jgi:hypothetical protein
VSDTDATELVAAGPVPGYPNAHLTDEAQLSADPAGDVMFMTADDGAPGIPIFDHDLFVLKADGSLKQLFDDDTLPLSTGASYSNITQPQLAQNGVDYAFMRYETNVHLNWVTAQVVFATDTTTPVVTGVMNGASFLPTPLSTGGLYTIFGRNLGQGEPQTATEFPLPTTLAGAQVLITDANGATYPCPLFYAAAAVPTLNRGQINFQMTGLPFGVALPLSLIVEVAGVGSNPMPVTIASQDPGAFMQTPPDLAQAQPVQPAPGTILT